MPTIKPKKISYKGVKIDKPQNISLKFIKQFIDECGKDYSFTVESAILFFSKKIKNTHE